VKNFGLLRRWSMPRQVVSGIWRWLSIVVCTCLEILGQELIVIDVVEAQSFAE
jgi:hypothetical protein